MTDYQLNQKQELEDYVQLKLDEWLLENPEPESIPELCPDEPESKFLSLPDGFVVLEVLNQTGIRLHVSTRGQQSQFVNLRNEHIQAFLDQIMCLQSDMQEFQIWDSRYKDMADRLHRWRSARGQLVSDARREFVQRSEQKS